MVWSFVLPCLIIPTIYCHWFTPLMERDVSIPATRKKIQANWSKIEGYRHCEAFSTDFLLIINDQQ